MSSLKEKAKTLNELLWENRLEWDKWLRLGVTEQKCAELAPKYHGKWVRLEDAEKEQNEFKQKLWRVLANRPIGISDLVIDPHLLFAHIMEWEKWFLEVEQLLEEEREAKPHESKM